jgi:hypothetical protein
MKTWLRLVVAGWVGMTAFGQGAPLILDWGVLDTASPEQQVASQGIRTSSRVATAQRLSPRGTVPWLVQFNDVIQEEWKTAMEAAGAEIRGYMPENGFLVLATRKQIQAIGAMPDVVYVGEFRPEYKRSKMVRRQLAEKSSGTREYNVWLYRPEDLKAVAAEIAALPGAALSRTESMPDRALVRVHLPDSGVETVTGWGEVEWVEPYLRPQLWNDVSVRTNMMGVTNVWTVLGLTGAGQTIAVCDTGLDTGNTGTLHRDFTNRVTGFGWDNGSYSAGNSWADTDSHGTHVAGSVLGSGLMSTGRYKGVAYEANLIFQGAQANLDGIPANLTTLFKQAFDNGARIHSDSWGYSDNGYYNADSRYLDMFTWSNKTMLVLVAAGNQGIDSNSDGIVDLDSIGSPATAKNCLTVGAAENYRTTGGYSTYRWGVELWPSDYPADPVKSDYASRPASNNIQGLAAFSSRGPCDDGRIKPDIVAPGTDIISTRSRSASDTGWGIAPNTNYLYMGGTSMATPLTAGAAGLTRQWLVEQADIANPSAALLKALLINGSRNMAPGQYGTGSKQEIPNARPNNVQGFGHVDLYNTLKPATNQFLDLIDTNSLSTGQSNVFTYAVTAGSTNKFILTMTYSDYWGTVGSGKQLINDLDLTVRKPGGTVLYANNRTSADATNNVEMIEFEADEAGTYTVTVNARTVPQGGSQAYALVVRGPAEELGDPEYGLRDDSGVNLPTLTYWHDGLGSDTTEKGSNFNGRVLGVRTQIYFKGASIKTWKTGVGDVTGTTFSYKAWKTGDSEPAYSTRSVGWTSNDGGGNQTWANFGAEIDVLSGLGAGTYNLKVLFTVAGTGVPGILSSGPFTATFTIPETPVLNSFSWSAISSPQAANVPFAATITAKDQFGDTFAGFASTANLSASVAATSTVGAGTAAWDYPLQTYYHDARSQVIYLQSDLGAATRLQGLALDVTALPGQTLNNWTLRLKHTASSTHASASWEGPASGWTTVFQGNATVSATGWAWFAFDTPFDYNGTDNLMIDFSYNNAGYTTNGLVRATIGSAGRALVGRSDSADGDPLDWSGTSPAPASTNRAPNIRLLAGGAIAMSPTATANFTNGVWAGPITVEEIATGVRLRATSGAASGDSALFDVAGDPPPAAPSAIWASATNATDFTAAWSAVAEATGYRLDVGESATFSGGGGVGGLSTVFRETMGNVGSTTTIAAHETANGFDNDDYTMSGGGAANPGDIRATSASSGYTDPLGNAASAQGNVWFTSTSADYGFGIAGIDGSGYDHQLLSFGYRKESASANATFAVQWSTNSGTSWVSITVSNLPAAGAATGWYMVSNLYLPPEASRAGLSLRWVKSGATAMRLDDVLLQGYTSDSPAQAFVPGYSNRTVSGTSESVTGLVESTTYYFRVRALNDNGTSPNSATASVTTLDAAPQDQTIDFPAIGAQWTTNILTLSATASSGLPVSFAVGSGPATISNGTTLAFSGAGTVSIVASQAGNGSWNPAPNVTNSFSVSKATAGVTLNGLAQTYDGTPRVVTATTVPGGLSVGMTYNGSGTAPTTAGSYAVTGTVSDAMYQGSAAGTLVVAKATAGVALGGLSHFHDGSPKSATVTTDPLGLSVAVTYDGSGSAPSAVGSYAVTATVVEVNYSGSAAGTLTISEMTVTNLFEEWLQDDQGQDPENPDFAWDADVDNDGMTTWEEFLADTDPASSNSVYRMSGQYTIAAAEGGETGAIRFSFPSSPNRFYQLVYSTYLFGPTTVSNLGWGVPGTMTITNTTTGTWYGSVNVMLNEP